ncbi:MAG: bifunctional [glutamine synthetase] adenylyltransferase/[glutamine synthetase]-adenylyl-L-tyrosine phosphorylase [Hyphomicrobiales bacterium]
MTSQSGQFGETLQRLPAGDDVYEKALLQEFLEKTANFNPDEKLRDFIKSVMSNAPYLRDGLLLEAEFIQNSFATPINDNIASLVEQAACVWQAGAIEGDVMRALRDLKRKIALLLALADLGQIYTCEQVTKALADFADAALLSAVRFSLIEEEKRGKIELKKTDKPEYESGLIVLAMGKHGAQELNYSSDIDLIIFYEPERIQCADHYEMQPAMVRVVKRIVKVMNERTEHGYVFRTDLRLRPDPGATAVAISTEAALTYYESLGQNWERAAFIKARPVACDIEAADAFLLELSPFIWRKYMDFATVTDVHAMKRQMHQHKGHSVIAIKGHNVKLGRGGIREIEFFVQTQQLIAGGRNPSLRVRGTISMLSLLAEAGWIDAATAEELTRHYTFLRNVEHRIQMRNDEQTHLLPSDDEGFEAVSRLMSYDCQADFEQDLLICFQSVSNYYGELFEQETEADESGFLFALGEDDPDMLETLSGMGYEKVKQVSTIVRGWHQGHYRALRNKRALETLTQIAHKLLTALSKTTQPDRALFAFDDFLKSLPAGVQLFSLLKENEHLLDLTAQLMGSAPRLSATIARHPHVFDALLEPAFFGAVLTREQMKDQLQITLSEAVDYQDTLDRVRVFTQEQQFLIGTRLLSNTVSIEESAAIYTTLAEVVLEALLVAVRREIVLTHGEVPGGDVAVLAMGKLGGREMSPTSDVDVILIYKAADDAKESDGRRPLAVSQYFSRVTQRFIAALSAPTGEGIAYPVDMRLRPSGKAGPLATSIEAFEKYQRDNAWTWEHMALTRARAIGGSKELNEQINGIVHDVLIQQRDDAKLRADVVEMNDRLHKAKEAKSIWDIKNVRGGMVDVEFLAQFYQLSHAAKHENLLKKNTGKALETALKEGILRSSDEDILLHAYRLYSGVIQLMRLCSEETFNLETAPAGFVARLCDYADVPDVTRLALELSDTQAAVLRIFDKTLKSDLCTKG